MYSHHEEHRASINASAARVFDKLDDPNHLTEHMSKRSWKMGWGRMETVLDAQLGRSVGSHIVLRGRVFGIQLYLNEVVTLRQPPLSKTWETVGEPRLLIIGCYQMGFVLIPADTTSQLRVTIDYDLPRQGISRLLGRLFGRWYAKWCTQQMVRDVEHSFER